jgi:glycosyltransferase involved in cell wall biosynthesis
MVRFHVLSFEGPDAYSRAGGIATRVCGLSDNLARRGFRTHLWFVGDPQLPGREKRGGVELHRWCQWISQNDGGGVYEGEEGKRLDYATSLPPHLVENELLPAVRAGDRAVVLAEEWHTADAVLHLDWRLRNAGIRDRVAILWNANNTFGFHRLDWQRLAAAAVITTVSRYMKQLMRGYGVDAVVIHNGLGDDAFLDPDPDAVRALRRRFRDRIVLSKVGRWDPDKNWLLAVAIVGELKRYGWRPLLLARGGVESHGGEVMAAARGSGLHVVERELAERGAAGLLRGTANINGADIVSIRSPLDSDSRALLFQGSSAVLANSAHEPFGLVGLEAMAVGGVACTGNSGEDYAVAGRNAVVMPGASPQECIRLLKPFYADPVADASLRRAARATSQHFTWAEIIERTLLPELPFAPRSMSGEPP